MVAGLKTVRPWPEQLEEHWLGSAVDGCRKSEMKYWSGWWSVRNVEWDRRCDRRKAVTKTGRKRCFGFAVMCKNHHWRAVQTEHYHGPWQPCHLGVCVFGLQNISKLREIPKSLGYLVCRIRRANNILTCHHFPDHMQKLQDFRIWAKFVRRLFLCFPSYQKIGELIPPLNKNSFSVENHKLKMPYGEGFTKRSWYLEQCEHGRNLWKDNFDCCTDKAKFVRVKVTEIKTNSKT